MAWLKRYEIKKGKHRSGLHFGLRLFRVCGGQLKFRISNTSAYTLERNQGQINKIGGWSLGLNHHKNSIRIGWESLNKYSYQYLQSYMGYIYYYNRGERKQIRFETPLYYDKDYTVDMYFNRHGTVSVYLFDQGMNIVESVDFPFRYPFHLFTYPLFPYFGGKEPAPHDIVIYLKKKLF